ncbi:MAG TPA: type IV pilus twitching motility protein PilT [Terriglobia bacterium]|nr:type IV pilus twitching motility protein PilT [Terriglobia bacterium]
MNLDELLRAAVDSRASDLHLKVGNLPHVRADGELRPLSQFARLTLDDIQALATALMSESQRQKFRQSNEIDLAYGAAGLGRFRVNVFRQRGSTAIALRLIPNVISSLDELHLPKIVETLAEERRGLILATGVTGSGKSTTLATVIDHINRTRPAHVITIEDPIEFLHRDKMAFVDQREVDVDTDSFKAALRAALRQDPDVILVGEMRDAETIQTALVAAETGHVVFSTLHTLDATETVQRIIAAFPPHDQQQIRLQLAATLKGVIAQRLLRRSDGEGRVPAVEVLVATDYIRDCIVTPEKTHLISQAIAAGASQYGMQTFDQSLHLLATRGLITWDDALLQASKPSDFRLRMEGIASVPGSTGEFIPTGGKGERFGG